MKIIVKTLMMLALVLALISGCGGPNVADPTETIPGSQVTIPVEDPTVSTTPSEGIVPTTPSDGEDITTPPTDPTEDVTTPTEPTEPSAPTEPTTPTIPSEPSEPTTPTVPSEPTDPTVPSVPTKPTDPPVTDYTLSLNRDTIKLTVGDIGNLTCTYNGTKSLTWKSSNTSVATVSNGKVTAKAAGTAKITVTDGVKSDTCTVTVKAKPIVQTEVKLSLNKTTLSLEVGKSDTLTYTYNGTKSLTWSSSNTSVATVSNGKVTAKAAGTAFITLSDGNKHAQCVVTVDYTLALNRDTLNLTVGDIGNLTCTYTGTKSLTWKSSNTSVATVSNGKVTSKAAGTAKITVTDGVKSDTCTVTVKAKPIVQTEVKLSLDKTTLSLEVGKSDTLSYTYNGTKSLTWSSSNTSVATVSNGKVTAKAAGTAFITLSDGNKHAQCVVTVKAKPETATLTINTPKDTIVFVGETLKLEYTYNGTGKLTFESYDTSRLTIDSNGKMTGISEGGVYVGVTDGNLLKSVRIVVKSVKATSIELWNQEGPLFDGVTKYVGDHMTFRARSAPAGTSYLVKAASSNPSVVSVSAETVNGNQTDITLKYKSAGSATITLTSEDGCVVYKYKVNVKSEYSCYPGKEKLTPEEFADACTQVMVANGFKKNTNATSYRVLTLSPNKLTWTIAKGNAQGYVRSWYPNGHRRCWISYEGTDEKGNYIFYTRWSD